ncbi:MAG TPA: VOC family protein [Baekduia sp.]|uniref:VOC family protein n=1 Tax=Baekduia sp. TaxID=2600305 RepID=UPI002D766170|nr:VOC family protein [Baekduia sp.]HET6506093.1 VOC family protein [Baekduia sp.]
MIALDHAGLTVEDLDGAAAFYARAFGFVAEFPFELGVDGIRGVMLKHPEGARLELFSRPGADGGAQRGRTPIETIAFRGYGHFALTVPATRLDDVYAGAVRAGAVERVSPRPSPEPGIRFAFVADPEGNLIELVGRPA